MEPQAYEAMARTEGEHWWFVGRRAIIRSLIETRVKPPEDARILEAGCGTGGNLALLSDFGKVEAFEFDDTARAIAKARSRVDVSAGRLPGGIEHIDGKFDMIALFDVLEHLDEETESLRDLASRLSPGGRIILTVPAMKWLWSRHDEIHHHHRRYSAKSLSEVVSRAGLVTEYMSHFNTLLLPAAIAQRLAARFSRGEPELDAIPAKPLNKVLASVFSSERKLLRAIRLPAGLSLCAVCRLK